MLSRTLAALLVLLALQFIPGVSIGEAQAGCASSSSGVPNPTCTSREAAYSECMAAANATSDELVSCEPYGTLPTGYQCYRSGFQFCVGAGARYFPIPYGVGPGGCPVGSWHEASKTCFSEQACLAKPRLIGHYVQGADHYDKITYQSCEFVQSGDSVGVCIGSGATACQSGPNWIPSGNPPPPPGEGNGDGGTVVEGPLGCVESGEGQSVCVKANGQHCYDAASGRRICWRPGETGEKVDGNILQMRVAGPPLGPPSPVGPTVGTPGRTPPYGAMYEPAAAGVQIMAKYGGFRESSTSGQPPTQQPSGQFTTTTQNFSTTNNVNAGGSDPDQGENADGTPGSTPGNQGEGGSEGGGVPGDANGNGQPDWTEGAAPAVPGDGEPGEGDEPGPPSIISMGVSMLDETGFLTPSTCPALGVLDFGPFGEFDMDSFPVWCDLVAIMRAIVLIMAAFASLKILMGSKD